MKFKSYTDEQIDRLGCLPEGEYDFEVIKTTEGFSKSGNEMLTVTLLLVGLDGQTNTVFDYLLDTKQMAFKIKHFFSSIGLEDDYSKEVEFFENNLLTKKGRAIVGIQKDYDGKYPAKNVIKDYIKPLDSKLFDQDVPF